MHIFSLNCELYIKINRKTKNGLTIHKRECEMHGKYRDYEDYLNTTKNYFMVVVTFIMLIIALLLYNVNLSLNWLYLFMGILVGPG